MSDKNKFQCADWLDYPIDLYGATGGLVDQVPVICGGWSHVDFDDCYKITANKAVFLGKMKNKRQYAASVVVNNSVLWVTGGINDGATLSSTDYINLHGTNSEGNSGYGSFKMVHSTFSDHLSFKVF